MKPHNRKFVSTGRVILCKAWVMQAGSQGYLLLTLSWIAFSGLVPSAHPATQEATDTVAGMQNAAGARLVYNEATLRLEVRDEVENLLEEIPLGSVSRTVDFAGREYRISFGKDELRRPSVIVRPGPAMRKPLFVEVFGKKAVLSPNSSLMATLAGERQVFYEPSICGEVYYIEDFGGIGGKESRLASAKREVAVIAKPSNATGAGPGALQSSHQDGQEMEKAGNTLKSAVFAVFGLPDKQPSGKAKVYRLRSKDGSESEAGGAASVSAEAGRP